MKQLIAKALLMVAWPLVAALIMAFLVLFMAVAWIIIPFGEIKKSKEGKLEFKFPWSE